MAPTKIGEIVVVPTLFLAYFILGASILGDFGVGWDEVHNRDFGESALQDVAYMFHEGKAIEPHVGHEIGPAFAMAVVAIEKALGLSDGYSKGNEAKSHLLYHIINCVYFFCSAVCFYFLCKAISLNWCIALLGVMLLVTHPRIFNHSFHNQKDIAFLATGIFALTTMKQFLLVRNAMWAAIHGIVCAIAIDIRIVAIAIPAVSVFGLLLQTRRTPRSQIPALLQIAIFGIATTTSTILFWPMLWLNPIENGIWALQKNRHIDCDLDVLYLGAYIRSDALPWHYNLVSIGLTTPIIYVALSLLGIACYLRIAAKPSDSCIHDNFEFYTCLFLWLSAPLVAPMVLQTVLYDGWRHHFFVYPVLVLFGVLAMNKLIEMAKSHVMRIAFYFGIATAVVSTIMTNVQMHPYQNVYLNCVSRLLPMKQTQLGHSFDMDYWGLAYREGLEYIALHTTGNVKVFAYPLAPAHRNHIWLPAKARKRLQLVDRIEQADYFISNYRWKTVDFPSGFGDEMHSVVRQGKKILTVRKRGLAHMTGEHADAEFDTIRGVRGY